MTGQTDQTFPRAQVASRARSVQEAIKPFCVNGAALLAGSLRRRQERVKDAAIVAVPLWEAEPDPRKTCLAVCGASNASTPSYDTCQRALAASGLSRGPPRGRPGRFNRRGHTGRPVSARRRET